jgi:hypothetical protein
LLPQAFYGVFDGHGGRAAVDFVSQRLGQNVVSAVLAAGAERRDEASLVVVEDDDAVSAAIRAAYLATDSELLAQHQVRVRTTTVTAIARWFLRSFTGSRHFFPTLNASKGSVLARCCHMFLDAHLIATRVSSRSSTYFLSVAGEKE